MSVSDIHMMMYYKGGKSTTNILNEYVSVQVIYPGQNKSGSEVCPGNTGDKPGARPE